MVEIKKGDVVESRMVAARESNGLLFGRLLVDGVPVGWSVDSFSVGVGAVVANHGPYVPKVEEPTGIGAVIKTDSGDTWVRFIPSYDSLDRWTNGYVNQSWNTLVDPGMVYGGSVTVLSEGVEL